MAFATWDPFREMEQLRREINRVFEDVGGRRWEFPFTRFSFLPGRAARAYPLINVSEDEENVYVEALAPGVNPDSLKVSVVRGQLTIAGEKPAGGENLKLEAYHRNERAAGRFVRTFALPYPVDEGRVKAEYRNGLLSIELPKAEAAKPKQISVKMG